MLDRIYEIASKIFTYGFCCDLTRDNENNNFRIKIKEMLIKEEETRGVILENLILSLINFKDSDEMAESLKKASVIIEKFSLLISGDWINKAIHFEDFEKYHVVNLMIELSPGTLSISGAYKKYLSFPFTIDFKFKVPDGKLVIEVDRFWAANLLPLPKAFQDVLMNVLQNYLRSKEELVKGIRFDNRFIHIDHEAIMPMKVYFDFQNVFINEDFIVFRGGGDRYKDLLNACHSRKPENEQAPVSEEIPELHRDDNLNDPEIGMEEEKEDILSPEPGE